MNFKHPRNSIIGVVLACWVMISPACGADLVRSIDIKGLQTLTQSEINTRVTLNSVLHQPLNQEAVLEDVQTLYLSGYFHQVSPEITPTLNGVSIVYRVLENPIIHKIQLTHTQIFTESFLKTLLKTKEGQILNLKTIQEDKSIIEQFYYGKGYEIAKVVNIQSDSTTGIVTFDINEGQIESISFKGLQSIPDFIVNREMKLKPATAFNSITYRNDRFKLLNLGFFSDVSAPQLLSGSENDKIRIEMTFKERKFNWFNYGIETVPGQSTIVGFLQGNVYHLLFPSSQLTGKIQLYTIDQTTNNKPLSIRSYSLRYYQPWILNLWPIAGSISNWNEIDYAQKVKNGADIRLEYPIPNENFTLSTSLKREKITPASSASYQIYSIAWGIGYKTIDHPFLPTQGIDWSVDYELGDRFGIPNPNIIEFSKYSINWANFWKLTGEDSMGLHLFCGVFYLTNTSIQVSELPGFTLGGANSLRGYPESIIEKPKKIVANLEYRHLFNSDFQGVVFFDIGRVGEQTDPLFTLNDIQYGYGVGLRYFTPAGPLRIDFGVGKTGCLMIHWNLGQVF